MTHDPSMMSRKTVFALAAALLVVAGCKGSGGKSDPNEPDEPYTNPLLEGGDEPPTTSMENQAGMIIQSSPSGMEVRVDGKSVGSTPVTVDNLSEGEHEVIYVDPKDGNVTYTIDLVSTEYKKVHHAQSPDASDAKMGGKQ